MREVSLVGEVREMGMGDVPHHLGPSFEITDIETIGKLFGTGAK